MTEQENCKNNKVIEIITKEELLEKFIKVVIENRQKELLFLEEFRKTLKITK